MMNENESRPLAILKRLFTQKYYLRVKMLKQFSKFFSDRKYLELLFPMRTGYKLNLDNPTTYNEKLQWIKLYDRNPAYCMMVDKYDVKGYIAKIIGEDFVIPTIGIYNNFDEINFNDLPSQFVLKCTHDSGGIVICDDKSCFDISKARKILNTGLKRNYYYDNREWPYRDLKPRIIAEQYMKDENTNTLNDYKVLCFNGVAKLIELHQGRYSNNHTQDFYDRNWKKTQITQGTYGKVSNEIAERPALLDDMIKLSEKLAANIPHVRVDWYIVNNHLYFGELTFFDGSGLNPWDRYEDDLLMGSWITLPDKKTVAPPQDFGVQGIDMFY